MASYPGIVTGTKVNHTSSLRIYCDEEKEGPFVTHPIGGIDADTSPLLQKESDQIAAAGPQFVVFDMQYVHYINTCGLIVILNAFKVVEQQGGRVGLMNMQPHIKKVFDIVNALPEQRIFASYLEFDTYLQAVQNRFTDVGCLTASETETDNCMICAEVNDRQHAGMNTRMDFQ